MAVVAEGIRVETRMRGYQRGERGLKLVVVAYYRYQCPLGIQKNGEFEHLLHYSHVLHLFFFF